MSYPTPAGWYPDPQGVVRWWDGGRWTEHIAPQAAVGYPAAQYPPAVVVMPRRSVGVAFLLALLFGSLGMLYATVPGAIVTFFMYLFCIIVGFFSFGLGWLLALPVWIIGIIWACSAAGRTQAVAVR